MKRGAVFARSGVEGIRHLEIVAARGRYLRPFAQTLLALAGLREKQIQLGGLPFCFAIEKND